MLIGAPGLLEQTGAQGQSAPDAADASADAASADTAPANAADNADAPQGDADAASDNEDAPQGDADAASDNEDAPQGDADGASDNEDAPSASSPTTTPQPTPGAAIAAGHDIAVIPVEGMIYDFTMESLKRRIDRALNDGATMIVIELDTPGGVVTSALDISSYLKSLQVPTVAWVNDQAYSAGTMLASACDEIVMAPAAVLGDSAPIAPGQNLSDTERAKVVSPVLADYRSNATANGYDYTLFHAMTELGVEVYLVEHKKTGQQELVNQADFAIMVEGRDPNASGFGRLFGGGDDDDAKVKPRFASEEDRGMWQPVEQLPSGQKIAGGLVHDGQTLLTMSQTEAMDVGLATAIIRNNNELRQHYQAASVVTVTPTWSEQLVAWLTHPVVKGVLVIGLLLGAYVEFQSPGLGV
ncbi:MAG: NfeD family protein, partial [Phycisphaeraceae bacterium]